MASATATAAFCSQDDFLLRNVYRLACHGNSSDRDSTIAAAPGAIFGASETRLRRCGSADAQLRALARPRPAPRRLARRGGSAAVCFYSLTRSVQQTAASIAQNVFAPLLAATVHLEFFLHTYNLSHTSAHSASPTALDWHRDVAMLTSALPRRVRIHVQVDDQARLMRRFASEFTSAFATTWSADGRAVGVPQYYLAAMHSLKRVTAMWQQRGGPNAFDVIWMLRPDLVYLDAMMPQQAVRSLKHLHVDNGRRTATAGDWLVVPPRMFKRAVWVDDKFAVGTPRAALLYGNRLDALMAFMRRHPKRLSELFLAWYLSPLDGERARTIPATSLPACLLIRRP